MAGKFSEIKHLKILPPLRKTIINSASQLLNKYSRRLDRIEKLLKTTYKDKPVSSKSHLLDEAATLLEITQDLQGLLSKMNKSKNSLRRGQDELNVICPNEGRNV